MLLPKWKDEDMTFVVALFKTHYPNETKTIASIVRDLGYPDRDEHKHPTKEYRRVRAALHAARSQKLMKRSGQEWGLP